MKKIALGIATVLGVLIYSTNANATIYNVICSSGNDTIIFNKSNFYNHVWVYVAGTERGDFWTVGGGSGTFSTTIEPGDHVILQWYNINQGYGQATAYCN